MRTLSSGCLAKVCATPLTIKCVMVTLTPVCSRMASISSSALRARISKDP